MGVGQIGFQRNGLVVAGKRFVQTPEVFEGVPAIEIGWRVIGIDLDRLRYQRFTATAISCFISEARRANEARRNASFCLECLHKAAGISQHSALVKSDRLLELLIGGAWKLLPHRWPADCPIFT